MAPVSTNIAAGPCVGHVPGRICWSCPNCIVLDPAVEAEKDCLPPPPPTKAASHAALKQAQHAGQGPLSE